MMPRGFPFQSSKPNHLHLQMSLVRKIDAVAFQRHTESYWCSRTRWAPAHLHLLGCARVLRSREIVTCQWDLPAAHAFHMNYKNCKNEQLEPHFIRKFEFSAPPTFFPGRQRCQNVLFIQRSKRKKMPNKLKIWTWTELQLHPFFLSFCKSVWA